MGTHRFVVLALGGVLRRGAGLGAAEDKAGRERALAEVKRLGGRVETEGGAGGRVVGVDLNGTRIRDASLAHLKGLTELRRLDLGRTDVTDEGLVSLKPL